MFRRATSLAVAVAAATLVATSPAATRLPQFLAAWGSSGGGNGQFNVPNGIAVDDRGDVYVADEVNNRIDKFTASGSFLARWGRNGGDGSPGSGAGELRLPFGVAVDGWGAVYVAEAGNSRVSVFAPDGSFLRSFGSLGTGDGQLSDPRGIGISPNGLVYVADHGNHRIVVFTRDGKFVRRWGRNGGDGSPGSGRGEFNQPRGVGFDRAGNVYVAEKSNHRIQEFTPAGRFLRTWGSFGSGDGQLNLPYGVVDDGRGHVYVADTLNNRVQVFDERGAFLGKWGRNGGDGSAGSAPGEFDGVYGIALDCRGGVYVTDEENARVQRFGFAGAAAPRCAPALSLRAPARVARGATAVVVRATCDRACQVRVAGPGVRAAAARLDGAGTARLTLRLDRAPPPRVALVARATGFAGDARAVRRMVTLAR